VTVRGYHRLLVLLKYSSRFDEKMPQKKNLRVGVPRWAPSGRRSTAAIAGGMTLWSLACTPAQIRYESVVPMASTSDAPEAVLFLVGDAGELTSGRDDVLAHLDETIGSAARSLDVPLYLAFLGDNIYNEGLPTEPSEEDLAKLSGQILALRDHATARAVFLPGNHDWANGESLRNGRAAIARQSEWIESVLPGRDIRFLPDDGCPGPAGVDVGASVRLVFIDTEWLLRMPEERCGTADAFYGRLTADLQANGDKRVVLMAHHPLVSGGPHGGNVAPLQRGPFVYFLARKTGASIQDISSRRYSTVVRRLQEAIAASGTRPFVYAAGHDHSLQVIALSGPGSPAYQLVSGAGSKSEPAMWVDGMRYATDGYGYMRLDFHADRVELTVYARGVAAGPVRPVYACSLSTDGTSNGCPEAPRAEPAS
jgi:hypothetical protein